MRRIFFLIHKWLAIPFGLFISIMCFTGAILLFKNEIAAWLSCNPDDLSFFKAVMRLHRWLFLVPENPHGGFSFGRLLMGASAIAASLVLISGVFLWIPKNKKALKSRLTVTFRKGWRRFVYDSHVSLGIYVCIFILLMSLTGPVWSFRWYRSGAVAVIGAEESSQGFHAGDRPVDGNKSAQNKNLQAVEKEEFGDAKNELGTRRHESATRRHEFPRKSDELGTRQQGVGKEKTGASAQQVFISLHTGKWGGIVTRTLYFLAAIIGGFLPLSGYYLWLKKGR